MADDCQTTLIFGMGGVFLVILAWCVGKWLDTRRDLTSVSPPHSGFRFGLAALYVCSAGLHVWLSCRYGGRVVAGFHRSTLTQPMVYYGLWALIEVGVALQLVGSQKQNTTPPRRRFRRWSSLLHPTATPPSASSTRTVAHLAVATLGFGLAAAVPKPAKVPRAVAWIIRSIYLALVIGSAIRVYQHMSSQHASRARSKRRPRRHVRFDLRQNRTWLFHTDDPVVSG